MISDLGGGGVLKKITIHYLTGVIACIYQVLLTVHNIVSILKVWLLVVSRNHFSDKGLQAVSVVFGGCN
jgi:hypothetical protein